MLTKPEHVQRAIKNAGKRFDDAYEKYMSDVRPEIAQEAIEQLIDGCRKLLAIAEYQQQRIEQLEAKNGVDKFTERDEAPIVKPVGKCVTLEDKNGVEWKL